jgi:hypothetical protein
MTAELTWQLLTQIASWTQQATRAAHNKREQRFAHTVANVGVLVAGLRHADRELRRLFVHSSPSSLKRGA